MPRTDPETVAGTAAARYFFNEREPYIQESGKAIIAALREAGYGRDLDDGHEGECMDFVIDVPPLGREVADAD